MIKKIYRLIFFFFISLQLNSQTTDLSIVAQAQSVSGNDISQIEIFQDFQYIVTIINTGNPVSNVVFEITMDSDILNLDLSTISSQNNSGGASDASDLQLNGSILTGTIVNLPNDSSVEIKIELTAPLIIGGIAIDAIITPPNGTTDTNTSNNQSLISIDVIDVPIDFTVTHTQVSPTEGIPITSWNSLVSYQFTVTNNSAIDYPLTQIRGDLSLATGLNFGRPNVQFESITCIGSTGGTECPDVSGVPPGTPILVSATSTVFTLGGQVYTAGGSTTFEVVYRYLEPSCALELEPIIVGSTIGIELFGDHDNLSANVSNIVITNLLEAMLCQVTDICIDTVQVNPDATTMVNWNEEVTFQTTVCNNGPLDANVAFFLQNLSPLLQWEIQSATCIGTTGAISCDDININIEELFWVSDTFIMPVGATITISTVAIFIEPECTLNNTNNLAHIRSGTNVLESDIFDSNIENSTQSDFVILPDTDACPFIDLSISKIQIDPELPEGEGPNNTTQVGNITYEITASNLGDEDTFIELRDYTINTNDNIGYTGTLLSVECVSATGDAECFTINNSEIGIPLDGISQGGIPDAFWEITPDDNWLLPANSSVTFIATVAWGTDCSISAFPVTNSVSIEHANDSFDSNNANNTDSATTYFAPCVDLVVQTFPEFTQVNVNQAFDWIIDITNSENSSNAIHIVFEDIINDVFTINGTPTCEVTDGNATCLSNVIENMNSVTGDIDNMDAGSTIRIRVPVLAPSFGGAYNNIAIATPNETDNREVSPETNTSISNVQIIAPILDKSFDPENITIGEESTLTFTINNLPSNPAQSDIAFTDMFPSEITVVSAPNWVNNNGCTATFVGTVGDSFVGISNLIFPEGVASCSFSVVVTSSIPGVYINNTTNFINQNNIDTSQTNATLTVLDDNSDVDISIIKDVFPSEASIGDQVTFEITATNLGTSTGTNIEIQDVFPNGLTLFSASVSEGIFNTSTLQWSLLSLDSNQSETLTIVAQVSSSTNLLNIAALNDLDQPDRDTTNNSDDAEVTVDFCLYIPGGLSPNNDGSNDLFAIECIDEFPGNRLKIFNRLGVQVYESNNYQNEWDGRPNMGVPLSSGLLPVGTYFYILDLNNGEEPIFGWVYLNY
ncbi:conserved repeat domain-containing protein/gliding motility-associated C-terminal domain-containing protein [Formosa sp. Hel1_31_208]|uniref:DUF7933 domain-containing protein n=1 Tax=Formosa sp. Hel1_31_208 TaxID=1798225 RepID=UPI0008798799|nr:gliding motility-associated C-terminal domain-containing protein [Formosa sp. Hel1_31_208]SDR72282.1 conserved repeat domain-containing protein/gliding motility-associated C-terminal domain-containing protein [Formosa sp. Hel1_31_208]